MELTIAGSLAECVRLLQVRSASAAQLSPWSSAPPKQEKASGFDVFLTAWCYQGGTWKEALQLIRRRFPELPVIVVCRTGGESEWVEVLDAGAFDMITAPFSSESVLFSLMNAVASQSEQQVVKVA